jgi:large subunit ribosomal protein L27
MAHKKAAGSAKNLRDSKPKYRGVKIYGNQPVKAGDIIIRQKGDTYKLGSNVYKGRDFSIHAKGDGIVHFGKKNYTRYDGKVYLKTFVEVITQVTDVTPKKEMKAPKKSTTTAKETAPTTTEGLHKQDLSSKTVAELKEIAQSMNLSGYSALKKAELVNFIVEAL